MDNHDQLKNISVTGHESHEVYVCNKCGWAFPNPHPSARHRRAHKKICGTIEGYKLIPQELQKHSDEDDRTPSPDPEKRSISGGIGNLSRTYSGSEVFSDAATEFSDSGFNPPTNSDKNVEVFLDEGQSLKVNTVADEPSKISQVSDPNLFDTATNAALEETRAEILENSSTENIKANKEILDSDVKVYYEAELQFQENTDVKDERSKISQVSNSQVVDTATNSPQEETKTTNSSTENIRENEEIFESDVKAVSEAELQVQENSDVKGVNEAEVKPQENIDVKAMNEAELQENIDVKAINEAELQENSDVKGINEAELQFKDVKDSDLMKTGIESVSVQKQNERSELEILKPEVESTERSNADLVEENLHVLSVSNDFPVIDRPEILIEDFKDHKPVKSKLDMSLDDLRPESESVEIEGDCLDSTLIQSDISSIKSVEKASEEPVMFVEKESEEPVMFLENSRMSETKSVEKENGEPVMFLGDSRISDTKSVELCVVNENENENLEVSEKLLEDSGISDTKTTHGTTNVDTQYKEFNHDNLLKQPARGSADVDLSVENEGEEPRKFPEDSGISIEELEDNKAVVQVVKEEPVTSAVEVTEKNLVCQEPLKLLEDSRISETKTTVETPYEECNDDKLFKQPPADVDLSVDSLSQTDSLEGNWGSVSVLSFQSDILANPTKEENLRNPKEKNLQQDSFDKPKTSEEIIPKTEKQHTNLKNLLIEANSKTNPTINNNNNNNNNYNNNDNKNDNGLETKKEKVNNEWNSPAKYPTDSISKEKKKSKGRPLWVPFICCSSAN